VFAVNFKILTHSKNEISQISKAQLKSLFLGDSFFFENKKRVLLVYINKDPGFEFFVGEVVSMKPELYNQYWRRRLFSGKAIPPRKVENAEKFFDYLQSEENALGVVSDDLDITKQSDIKIMTVRE
jgi:hypothetical protein